jgi:hypothetical protein
VLPKKNHVSETPATVLLKAIGIAFTEHPYAYFQQWRAARLFDQYQSIGEREAHKCAECELCT